MEKSTNNNVASRFLYILFRRFGGLAESVKLWIDFSQSRSDFSEEFSQLTVRYDREAGHNTF